MCNICVLFNLIISQDGFRNVFKDLEESDDDMTSSLSSDVNLDNGINVLSMIPI